MRRVRLWALPAAVVMVTLPLIGAALTSWHVPAPPVAAAQAAAAQTSCVRCHTSRAALEPLVRPLPPPPAEGEG
ncbi:MAG: hypothetical protein QN152_01275 [Armatimonadota bacterium]|nr:hypothetical protein [Armatimonadota bacterium]MDR7426623.1 hypothetical protein [Armatimonadota bacterium]MDR7464059.1 hypothetical protein [Armatimonadota bacterium]MDR7468643.1 hypothetical protein [Armatimonadota bacterium]MDR7473766.1 hypothetical protein [Armatimonadota bacterium]